MISRASIFCAIAIFSTGIAHADASVPDKGKSESQPGALSWRKDFAAGMADALKSKQRVMMLFCADWAMPCFEMKKRAFTDADVIALIKKRFVPLYVDLTDEEEPHGKAFVERYKAMVIPLFILFDRQGHEVKRHPGSIDPAELVKLLASVP
jgi:thiol:disulfide interchange protein